MRLAYACFTFTLLAGCGPRTAAPVSAPTPVPVAASSPPRLQFKDYNFVFVSFDALQAARVGSLGYSRTITPTIDAMAKDGVSFTRAYSVSSWTVPASMSWFTGVYPSEHKMVNKFAIYRPPVKKPANLKDLSPNLVTLAEIFRQNGYATGGFTGNAGVSGGFGYEAGFDIYYHEDSVFGSFDQSLPVALQWLTKNKDRKFFAFLHGYDVHGQYTPAGGYDYRFVDPKYDRRYNGSEAEQELLREEGLVRGRVSLREPDVRFWRAVYDEKVQRADKRFRDFLTEFDKLGVSDKTVFVLTSDHGTELYEHQRFDHGFTLYDELLRVPLVLKTPEGPRGLTITDRVSSIDVMPTIVDLMGLSVPDGARSQFRGTSLIPAIRGDPVRRDLIAETDYRAYTFKRALIDSDGWKFIYTLENKFRELYDTTADPTESRNLVTTESARADELQRRLFQHFERIGQDLTRRNWEIGLNPVYASQAQDEPKK